MSVHQSILLPLTYLGPVSYFSWILQAREVVIEMHEHYIKQTYRNRCRILTSNGTFDLIIPVIKVNGNHTHMHDMEIAYTGKWQLNHWRAIVSAYGNAPYFIYYASEIEPFFKTRYVLLSEFDSALIERVIDLLGIPKEINYSRSYRNNFAEGVSDCRKSFNPRQRSVTGFPEYSQVFSSRWGFKPDLSIIDLLFNMGPGSKDYLMHLSHEGFQDPN